MKKSRNLSKMLLLILAIMLLFQASNVSAKTAPIAASVKVDKTTNTLTIMKDGQILDTCIYKKEVVYAKKSFKLTRLGPGAEFTKSNKLKKSAGDSITRVGVTTDNKWSIVNRHGRYYFVINSVVTNEKPKNTSPLRYTARQLKHRGVIRWGGWRWTWYSQRVMPGRGLHIPGRHVSGGYVCDKNGYICLASGRLRRGTVVRTPFGRKGKVYDSGCARNTLDVYTNF